MDDLFVDFFAQARANGLLLAAFYQLDNGAFRVKWRRKNGEVYDFSEPQMSADPMHAMKDSLAVAINTLPPVRAARRRIV